MWTPPSEIIVAILCRLPVKSLKRCRAVAKWWCFLIDSDYFIKLHLSHTKLAGSNRNLILGGVALYSIDLDSLDRAHVIKPPFYYRSVDSITNSCNGLVVVTSEPPVLWNPFSRNSKVLPGIPGENQTGEESYSKTAYGIAYDSQNDDYKLVKVVEFRNSSTHEWICSEAMIYSTKLNSWRRVDDFPYPLPFLRGNWRVLVNGAMHTLLENLDHIRSCEFIKIMAFSVETEKHYEVVMPEGSRITGVNASLDVLEGSLCVVCAKRSRVIVWVMQEYGVKESWTKLLSLRPPVVEPDEFVKPLIYLKDLDKILLNCADKRLGVYDTGKKTIENVPVDGLPFMFYTEVCVESLVWVDPLKEDSKLGAAERKGKKGVRNSNRDDFLSEGFKLVL